MNRIETGAGAGLPRRKARAKPMELPGARRCRRKFLQQFPGAFRDETYLDWERDYKVEAHRRWLEWLGEAELTRLIAAGEHGEIARRAVWVEQRTRHSMIFSFEKMALRDAVRSREGARAFATGLHELLHGAGDLEQRFEAWVDVVAWLPRRQTRVLTWPMVFRDPAFVRLLRRQKVALVVADTAGKWPLVEDVTADFVYVRLHGDAVLYTSGYSDAALEDSARRIRAWSRGGEVADARKIAPGVAPPPRKSRDVYCYFDNDAKVHAPFDARRLIGLLAGP